MTAPDVAAGVPDEQAAWWTARGAAIAPTLSDLHAIVLIGADPVGAAHAALGLARVESVRRRVAVADLVGDVAPLAALVDGDDPHGVVDSFLYGVSLNRVARPADGSGNLFVIPSGTEPVLTEEIFRSERWRRLAAGFREAGALLILVAPASAPGLEDLVAMLDGAVVAGDAALGASVRVLAVIPPMPAAVPEDSVAVREPRGGRVKRMPRDSSSAPWLTPVLLGTIVVGLAAAYFRHAQTPAPVAKAPVAVRDTTPAPVVAAPPRDTAPAPLVVENPSDSSLAAAYAVALIFTNTQAGAEHELDVRAKGLPAATVSPVITPDNVQWYRVYAGAYTEHARADSLRGAIERARRGAKGTVSVVRAPFALLLDRGVRADSLELLRGSYLARGTRPYALKQADGTINLYVGAFERAEQAGTLADSLRAHGLTPALVYRTGAPL